MQIDEVKKCEQINHKIHIENILLCILEYILEMEGYLVYFAYLKIYCNITCRKIISKVRFFFTLTIKYFV